LAHRLCALQACEWLAAVGWAGVFETHCTPKFAPGSSSNVRVHKRMYTTTSINTELNTSAWQPATEQSLLLACPRSPPRVSCYSAQGLYAGYTFATARLLAVPCLEPALSEDAMTCSTGLVSKQAPEAPPKPPTLFCGCSSNFFCACESDMRITHTFLGQKSDTFRFLVNGHP
jgi:hypothetical protein